MFKPATTWELKLGRVASFVFTGLFSWLLVSSISRSQNNTWLEISFDYFCYSFGFLFYSAMIFFSFFKKDPVRDAKFYPVALLISIFAVNLVMFADFHSSHIIDIFRLPLEDFDNIGRSLYYQLVPVPVILIFALFHFRPWAFMLFYIVGMLPILFRIFWIIQHPNTYFTRDYALLSDSFAMNEHFFGFSIIIFTVSSIFACGLIYFYNYALAAAQKTERKNALLGRYFAPDVRNEIEKTEINLANQEPKDLNVAIMFTDIIGFTKLSEKMKPKEVMRLLSDYQSIMVEAIFENSGTVDKFIGDAVMANFGTPKSYGNDAQNAFNCAVSMNQKLTSWNENRKLAGLSEIHHRIGIHFGPCVVGNIGGEQRIEFAIIGDAVNVASRICDACKQFDTNFLVSSTLSEHIDTDRNLELHKDFEVRGRSEKIDLMKVY
jgi:adenylate cyclase